MLALILALAAAAPAPGPDADTTVSPVTVTGSSKPPPADVTLQMQGSTDDIEQAVVIWPGTAYQAGIGGRVSLRCLIDVHGVAEHCEVAYEAPVGKGFGAAALLMRPTIHLEPTIGANGPVEATKVIAIAFRPPERLADGVAVNEAVKSSDYTPLTFAAGNAMNMRRVIMLDSPVWAAAPSYDDLAGAYPAAADGEEGYAVNHCAVRRDGTLEACLSLQETPAGRGFGRAALSLAGGFRVGQASLVAPHSAHVWIKAPVRAGQQSIGASRRDELWVDVAVRFPSAEEATERTVTAPVWLTGLDPEAASKAFPPEAAASGVTSGRSVARCDVGADGALTACTAESAEPSSLGFGEAAARLASTMKMGLWSADAAPVVGGVVHVPIRLNLKGS